MEEINAVVKPLVDSAVGATEKAGSALVDAGETALGAVAFVLTAGVGKTADEAHDTVQPKSDSTGSPEPATAAGGASCTGSDVSPLHFTGKMRDAETGLDEFPARY